MNYCPNCHADVTGLVHHCDLCGAMLNSSPKFFSCACHETSVSGDYSIRVIRMIGELESEITPQDSWHLERVVFATICYPNWMVVHHNLKNKVYYSESRKYAKITLVADYNEFINAIPQQRNTIVTTALSKGLHALCDRMKRYEHDITDLVEHAERVLEKLNV